MEEPKTRADVEAWLEELKYELEDAWKWFCKSSSVEKFIVNNKTHKFAWKVCVWLGSELDKLGLPQQEQNNLCQKIGAQAKRVDPIDNAVATLAEVVANLKTKDPEDGNEDTK